MKVALDDRKLLIYQNKNPILVVEFVSDGSYAINSLDGKPVGKIQKLWESDRMAIWPMDLLVEAKAACLVALLLLEILPTKKAPLAVSNGNPAVPIASGPSVLPQPSVQRVPAAYPPVPYGAQRAVPQSVVSSPYHPAVTPFAARPIAAQPMQGVHGIQFPMVERWAPMLPPVPGCSPGLEQLTILDKALVCRMREKDTRNRYVVLNKGGERVYFLQEMNPGYESAQNTGGFEREINIRAYDCRMQEVWSVSRSRKDDMGCCCCCCIERDIHVDLQGGTRALNLTNHDVIQVCLAGSGSPSIIVAFLEDGNAVINTPDGRRVGKIKNLQRCFIGSWARELPVLLKLGCLVSTVLMDIFFFDTKHVRDPTADEENADAWWPKEEDD